MREPVCRREQGSQRRGLDFGTAGSQRAGRPALSIVWVEECVTQDAESAQTYHTKLAKIHSINTSALYHALMMRT